MRLPVWGHHHWIERSNGSAVTAVREKCPSRGRLAQAGESALEVAAGTDQLIACMTSAHTSRLSASVAVARLGPTAAADLADNQGRLSLLPEETRW
jgi:hypothetical protein